MVGGPGPVPDGPGNPHPSRIIWPVVGVDGGGTGVQTLVVVLNDGFVQMLANTIGTPDGGLLGKPA